jgi:hypothetical protein
MMNAGRTERGGHPPDRRPSLILIRSQIQSSFPRQISELIWEVVQRTRLRTHEKILVAEDLIDHFKRGIAEGATPEALVATFGDPTQAAKLIRRAQIRCRHWADRLIFVSLRAAAIVGPLTLLHLFLLAQPDWTLRDYVTLPLVVIGAILMAVVPGVIADSRRHPKRDPIAALGRIGFFFWPLWLVALAWALAYRPTNAPESKLASE